MLKLMLYFQLAFLEIQNLAKRFSKAITTVEFQNGWALNTVVLQWNLFVMDTLGLAISGSFLLLYRGFPLSEVKMY